jgi:hypothetical protein
LKQEEKNTINVEIPYQFQEKHEEALPYQEHPTNIPRTKHPRDIIHNAPRERDRAKCPNRAKISAHVM